MTRSRPSRDPQAAQRAALLEQLRFTHRCAPIGSTRRKAAAIALAALERAGTTYAARHLVTRQPLPTEVRKAAHALLSHLQTEGPDHE